MALSPPPAWTQFLYLPYTSPLRLKCPLPIESLMMKKPKLIAAKASPHVSPCKTYDMAIVFKLKIPSF